MRVTLVIETRYEAARELPLEGYSLTLGRTDAASVVVRDEGLSRRHATVHRGDDAVWVVDEGSTNGTLVNGAWVPESGALLKDGDRISIGNYTTVTVRIASPHAAATHAPAYRNTQTAPAVAAPAHGSRIPIPYIAAFSAAGIVLLAALVLIGLRASGGDSHAEGDDSADTLPTPSSEIVVTEIYTGDEFVVEESVWPTEETGEDFVVSAPTSSSSSSSTTTSSSGTAPVISLAAIRQSLSKVMEDRGQATGQDAAVEVPSELRHYPERGRFLALQTAEAREQRLLIPHDFAELAQLIRDRRLVEVSPVTENYVIYAVAGGVQTDVFTHFDRESGRILPLFRDNAALEAAIRANADGNGEALAAFYKDARARQLMASEYDTIFRLARDFDGRSYNLDDAAQRKEFRRRMLSFVHPSALRVLDELGAVYRKKYGRPLPIASLVRTEQYQRELSESNSNAARNSLPPHTTGLAFDISYRFMTAEEQAFLMAEIARLERGGRVEALRENNNCFHIFAYADGRPPAETLVRQSLGV